MKILSEVLQLLLERLLFTTEPRLKERMKDSHHVLKTAAFPKRLQPKILVRERKAVRERRRGGRRREKRESSAAVAVAADNAIDTTDTAASGERRATGAVRRLLDARLQSVRFACDSLRRLPNGDK